MQEEDGPVSLPATRLGIRQRLDRRLHILLPRIAERGSGRETANQIGAAIGHEDASRHVVGYSSSRTYAAPGFNPLPRPNHPGHHAGGIGDIESACGSPQNARHTALPWGILVHRRLCCRIDFIDYRQRVEQPIELRRRAV